LPAQLALHERFKTIDRHEFARYLSENRVQAALLDRQDLRDVDYMANMPGFRQAHADDIAILFVRNDLLAAPAATAPGSYRYLRPGGYEFEYLAPLAAGPEAALVEEELLRAAAGAPEGFFENFLLAYFYDARNDPRAAARYLLAARKNPGFAFTHFEIGARGGRAALRAGQWALAVEIVTQALEYQKTGEHHFLLGAAQQQLQRRPAAEKSYRTSLELAENGRVRNNLGFLLLDMGEAEAAKETFAKGLDQRSGADREQSLYGLAQAYATLKNDREASAMRVRLATEFPQSSYLGRLP
jgi:tetratricopeptide (TPR) repeat protein